MKEVIGKLLKSKFVKRVGLLIADKLVTRWFRKKKK